MLSPYVKLPCHRVASGTLLPLNQWSHVRQTLREKCWAVRPALQTNSNNCLVLILHRQLENYLLSTGESYSLTAQHMQDSIQVNVWHLPIEHLLTATQHSTLYRILVPFCSSNVAGKIVSSWHRNSGPVTCLLDGHHGNTSCPGCSPLERTHMYFSNTENFPYPRKNGFSTHWLVLHIVTQKERGHPQSIRLLPERLSMPQITL